MDAENTKADRTEQSLEDRIRDELKDTADEELELELGDDLLTRLPGSARRRLNTSG